MTRARSARRRPRWRRSGGARSGLRRRRVSGPTMAAKRRARSRRLEQGDRKVGGLVGADAQARRRRPSSASSAASTPSNGPALARDALAVELDEARRPGRRVWPGSSGAPAAENPRSIKARAPRPTITRACASGSVGSRCSPSIVFSEPTRSGAVSTRVPSRSKATVAPSRLPGAKDMRRRFG